MCYHCTFTRLVGYTMLSQNIYAVTLSAFLQILNPFLMLAKEQRLEFMTFSTHS